MPVPPHIETDLRAGIRSARFSTRKNSQYAVLFDDLWYLRQRKFYANLVTNDYWVGGTNFRNSLADWLTLMGGSFGRSSHGYRVGSTGVYEIVDPDVVRLDHEPHTLRKLGLLYEPDATNFVRNNSMQGADVSGNSPPDNWTISQQGFNGVDRDIVGVGVDEAGRDYLDWRIHGTPTSSTIAQLLYETSDGIPASVGQEWAISSGLSIAGGSVNNVGTILHRWQQINSLGANLQNVNGEDVSGLLSGLVQRFSDVTTLNQADVAFLRPSYSVQFFDGLAVDLTLRITWPQVEQNDRSTSPIRTTSAAASRSADSLSIEIPEDVREVVLEFDDRSQQVVQVSEGPYQVPVDLTRLHIRSIAGYQ